jgi:SAM-dependent methyltransferase
MNPAVEYAWELASEYWPGLPRADFDAYSEVGVDAAVLLEAEWQDMVVGPNPDAFKWQDMSAASQLDRDRIRDFYDHGFGLIFELMRGLGGPPEMGEQDHRANIVHQYMTHLAGHGPILDYGGGIGQQSIFLARLGWEVAYSDLGETAAFARWRFDREGLLAGPDKPQIWGPGLILPMASPEAALGERAIPPHTFPKWGALAALDVVEHIPDPVGLLQRFAASMAPDGLLFLTRHSFREYPAHLPETGFLMEKLDDVLAGMGYKIVIRPDPHFGIGAWQKTGV